MKSALKASAALALVTQLTPAFAQEVIELDEITLYTNQSATELTRSGTTVEVVTEDELQAAPQSKLADTFAKLPGLTVTSNGGFGTATTFRIRGLGQGYVPVYFDGIDISDPASSGNGFDWGSLSGAGLSRAEVLKGSQSARYGATAVGGVVNLSSYRPAVDGFSGQSSFEIGSYNTKRTSLGLGFMDERTEIGFSFARALGDGFSASSVGTEPDGFDTTQASLFAAYNLTDRARVGFNLFYLENQADFDAFGGDDPAPYNFNSHRTSKGARLFAEFETGAIAHSVSYSRYQTDRTVQDEDFFGTPRTTTFDGTRDKLSYTASVNTSQTMAWSFGLEHNREEGGGALSETNSAFAELTYTPNAQLDITASLRYDDNKQFGSKATGRLALAYQLGDDMTLRAQAATGHKPPTLYQLTSGYGRPDFTPESSATYELGLEKSYGERGFARITAFYNDLSDKVSWDNTAVYCASGFGCYVQADLQTKGVELSGEYAFGDVWTFSAAYTYTDAQSPFGRSGRVPRHDVFLGLDAAFDSGMTASIGLNHVADRVDFDGSTFKMPSYTLVNAGLSYPIAPSAEVYLRMENITDEQYETSGGYGTAGRSAYFGVRAEF